MNVTCKEQLCSLNNWKSQQEEAELLKSVYEGSERKYKMVKLKCVIFVLSTANRQKLCELMFHQQNSFIQYVIVQNDHYCRMANGQRD